MKQKRFSKNDSGFVCENCGFSVMPLNITSRNHCPHCLYSIHIDVNPGDRMCECHGIMEPIESVPDPKKGFVIIHKCKKCGFVGRNKAALNYANSPLPKEQYDDEDLLIKLTAKDF